MKELIRVEHINKKITLSQGIELRLLEDVNFTIYEGTFVTITGISGTGKSSLLGILLGYDRNFEGDVLIDNNYINTMNNEKLEEYRNNNMGVCYSDKLPKILNLTVKGNICSRLKEFYGNDVDERSNDIINTFKLNSSENKKVTEISKNDLYRLMLALAFCTFPPIIIIDEILDYFPEEEKDELLRTMVSIQKEHNMTMILVTIDIKIINQSDRAINIMNNTTWEVDLVKLRKITRY